MHVDVPALGTCVSGLGCACPVCPLCLSECAHLRVPVRSPFRLCWFLVDAEPVPHLESHPAVCDFPMVTVSPRSPVTCAHAHTHVPSVTLELQARRDPQRIVGAT